MIKYSLIIYRNKDIYMPVVVFDDYTFARIVDYCCIHEIDFIFKHFSCFKQLERYIYGALKKCQTKII